MAKLRKTFLNIALDIKEKREFQKLLSKQKSRRFLYLKIAGAFLALALLVYGIRHVASGFLSGSPTHAVHTAPQWDDIPIGSPESKPTELFVKDIFEALGEKGVEELKGAWSVNTPPETVEPYEETLKLFKGGGLSVQRIRKKADASGKYEVLCKSPSNGHRLKLSLRIEDKEFKIVSAEMTP